MRTSKPPPPPLKREHRLNQIANDRPRFCVAPSACALPGSGDHQHCPGPYKGSCSGHLSSRYIKLTRIFLDSKTCGRKLANFSSSRRTPCVPGPIEAYFEKNLNFCTEHGSVRGGRTRFEQENLSKAVELRLMLSLLSSHVVG